MRRPDVLLVADGESIHTRRLAEGLRDIGVALDVACFQGAPIPGVRVHSLGDWPTEHDRRYVLAIPRLARLLRRLRPRLVHAIFVSSYGLMTATAHSLAFGGGRSVPLVQTALGTDLLVRTRTSRLRAALARFTLGRADLATGNSEALRNEAARLAPTTPWHVFVWGPPHSLVARERHPAPIVVSNRRLAPNMRVDRVVRAFRAASAAAPTVLAGWRLVVTNDGSAEAVVRAAAAKDPAIEFVGTVGHEELHDLLLRARVVVSIPESDSTSAALMDALAAGVLPVVGALPAPLEWVDASVAEVVPDDPSVDAVAAAIIRAAGRQVDPAALRARVRDAIWEDELRRLAAAYRSLVSPADPVGRASTDRQSSSSAEVSP